MMTLVLVVFMFPVLSFFHFPVQQQTKEHNFRENSLVTVIILVAFYFPIVQFVVTPTISSLLLSLFTNFFLKVISKRHLSIPFANLW